MESFADNGSIRLTNPVDRNLETVVLLSHPSGAIGRKTQNGRTAHAPMRDEQRSFTSHLGSHDGCDGVFHHCSHQFVNGFVGNVESEKRRNGRYYFVPQVLQVVKSIFLRMSSCCNDDTVGICLFLPVIENKMKCVSLGNNLPEGMMWENVHTYPSGIVYQTVDDALGGL